MSNLNVLVAGGGIAGPVVAYWLAKAGAKVTIVERSPTPRKTGQSIDIRGPAVTVMRKMGLEEAVRAAGTPEKGLEKVNATGNIVARFDATGDASQQSATSEFEILRADLARIFTDALKDSVEVVYGEYVTNVQQHDKTVDVTFANGERQTTYDLLIVADGMNSRTRSLVTGKPAQADYYKLDAYCAYFTIPRGPTDSDTIAKIYTAPKGRFFFARPTPAGDTGVCLTVISPPDEQPFIEAATADVNAQKQMTAEYFQDAGWEAERIVAGMNQSDDFYFQEVAQVRLDRYYFGRVALVGDTAYCPSPFSGMGTSAAIYGAYALAGEIAKQPHELDAALAAYDKTTRAFVQPVQQRTPMWVVRLLNPQSQFAVDVACGLTRVARFLISLVQWLKIDQLVLKVAVKVLGAGDDLAVPEYDWDDKKTK